jgi:hypothetical protein
VRSRPPQHSQPIPISTPIPRPAGELRILVGGFLEEVIGELLAKMIEKQLGYSKVSMQIIEDLPAFLETAAQSPLLFMVYLIYGDPAVEAVTDPATCRAESGFLISPA